MKILKKIRGNYFLLFFALIFLVSPASAKACEVCPLNEESGRILIHLCDTIACPGKGIRSDKQDPSYSFYGPLTLTTSIPAGNYKITLVSYDDHSSKPSQVQPNEQWYMELYNNSSSLIVTTSAIGDLPDPPVSEDWKTEIVNSNLNISENIISFSVFHSEYSNIPTVGKPNSILPVCVAFDEIPVETVNIIASKVICNNESDLPNWGGDPNSIKVAGEPNIIGPDTAQNYVSQHQGCYLAEGWSFQVGENKNDDRPVKYPGDFYGEATMQDGWTTFGPTDLEGKTQTTVILTEGIEQLRLREILQDGYIPFTYPLNNNDVSAEFYCHNDMYKYDNYDYIRDPRASETYYCIAFNAPISEANPVINVVKSANPTSLPAGGGNVNYSYAVTNPGNVTLTTIVLSDDKCSPVNYISGDTNTNNQLETTETWNYTCSKNIAATTTNIATVTGKYLTTNVDDTDTATVTVNLPANAPAIKVVKSAVPTSLPAGGGNVVYSFVVTNIGNVTLTNITLNDDKCSPVNYTSGDANTNNQLETTETWNYTCAKNITGTTTNIATATGKYGTTSVQDTDEITVAVAPPQTCVSGCGGGSLFPAIRLIKTPMPYQLPKEGGSVIYTYLVSNPGYYTITDVVLTDDKCSEIKFIDGDKNMDKKLDRNEIWKYACQTNLTATTINTATVNGKSSAGSVKDTTKATVYVPKMDLAIKLEKTASPSSLSEKGGIVTYSYKVSNKGSKAISDVTVTDDKCSPINFISGDTNKDKKLDTSEIWIYTCQSNLTKTTVNTGTARGQVDGKYATDTSEATVRVEKVLGTSIIPKGMPKTGFGGSEIISGYGFKQILIAIFILLVIAIVKPRIKKTYY